MSTTMHLPVPAAFRFRHTLFSHGWCMLPPFHIADRPLTLHTVLRIDDRILAVSFRRGRNGKGIEIATGARVNARVRKELLRQAEAMFFIDLELRDFYALTHCTDGFSWIARKRAGRMFRAPTFFEDVVKMILTTNCSWSLTLSMCRNLVRATGGEGGPFPRPEEIARLPERILREKVKLGYRAPYVLQFARRTADGEFAPEAFRGSMEPTETLYSRLRAVKGIGPYAAENLLKLLGRFDHLGLDSWSRARYAELHAGGRPVKDGSIEAHYAPFGKWKGLAFWLDVTQSLYNDKFPFGS